MTSETLPATTQSTDEKRQAALIRALGLDKVQPEQRELALAIADRYQLDPMLRHLVLIDGRPFITRDGLLHVAHRSGRFDGIEVEPPELSGGYWHTVATAYRKDMSRGFRYPGRYPEKGKNAAYGPEMAIKVAESMSLRRAFDVAAPAAEERWAEEAERELVDKPAGQTLADIARARADAIAQDAPSPSETAPDAVEATIRVVGGAEAVTSAPEPSVPDCGAVAEDGLMAGAVCILEHDHKGAHKSADGSWPR